ncbi:hypothetical protein [uncultured Winogradskyella sp.]|uniref:hypothetical protein n=1 Tax=uncultured Winogradskyella sp. TaxID=395353 RepID=UPI0030EF2C15|tara:strand:- start:2726 stop:3184 length:459 start_codon:yes stop_codon:yes gene_type:complete
MLKKANILFLMIIAILMSTMPIRCGSVAKKDTDSSRDSQKEIKVTEKVDWEEFNKDAQIAIKERESQIEELRKEILINRKKEQQKLNTTLDSLERKKNNLKKNLTRINKKLKTNLDNINESDNVLKSAFENAFVKDMNELLAGLRDFWKTSK